MLRIGPGFPIGNLTVGASGCTVTIENASKSRDTHKVTVTPGETTLTKFGKTASEALGNAAAELEQMAASVRQLVTVLEKL
jgi:hypothetical protein